VVKIVGDFSVHAEPVEAFLGFFGRIGLSILRVGLSFVLVFVGVKMMVVDVDKITIGASRGMIRGMILLSVLASLSSQRGAAEDSSDEAL